MRGMTPDETTMEQGFVIWITGLPASGKSSTAKELVAKLRERGVRPVVLESDVMRRILTPEPTYAPEERDWFYRMLAEIASAVAQSGTSVIIDATANRRLYRNYARARIPKFVEVFIDCPLEICRKRDPKGIYALAASGASGAVPGIQAPYEPPLNPEITLDCRALPATGADAVIRLITALSRLPPI